MNKIIGTIIIEDGYIISIESKSPIETAAIIECLERKERQVFEEVKKSVIQDIIKNLELFITKIS